MLNKLKKALYYKMDKFDNNDEQSNFKSEIDYEITGKLQEDLKALKAMLGKSDDIVFREFEITPKVKACICAVEEMVDKSRVEEIIIKLSSINENNNDNHTDIAYELKEKMIYSFRYVEYRDVNKLLEGILAAKVALLMQGYDKAIIIEAKNLTQRSIGDSNTEVTLRGSKEAFVEDIEINMSLIRKIIKSPKLIIEINCIGEFTKTRICLAYIEGMADKSVVSKIKEKLNSSKIEAVLESGYIEQYMDEYPLSPFPTIGNSEKPDKVAAKLLEGRVAIICDGTPFVLTLPYLFVEAFQTSDDYYGRPIVSSINRNLRYLAFFITVTVPSLYVALTTFHEEMLPPVLLLSFLQESKRGPLPAAIEVLGMSVVFELIKESGVRMPKPVGQAVSIVGALVIGQSAVEAGIITAPIVIITSITGITSFIVPSLLEVQIVIRIIFLLLSSIFGLFGFIIASFLMIAHMCSLEPLGVSYLSPFTPMNLRKLNDSIFRTPFKRDNEKVREN